MRKKRGYWNKERCKDAALLCQSKVEFCKKFSRAFKLSRINGWLNEFCLHMPEVNKPHNYWDFDKCKDVALNNFPSAYDSAYNNNWLDDICQHMKICGNLKYRCVYSYEFPDNHVYVGITYNLKIREQNRNNDISDSVTSHIMLTNLNPIRIQISDYIPVESASTLEGYYVEKYRNAGWNILNKCNLQAYVGLS